MWPSGLSFSGRWASLLSSPLSSISVHPIKLLKPCMILQLGVLRLSGRVASVEKGSISCSCCLVVTPKNRTAFFSERNTFKCQGIIHTVSSEVMLNYWELTWWQVNSNLETLSYRKSLNAAFIWSLSLNAEHLLKLLNRPLLLLYKLADIFLLAAIITSIM